MKMYGLTGMQIPLNYPYDADNQDNIKQRLITRAFSVYLHKFAQHTLFIQ